MLRLPRSSRSSFYYTQGRSLPISESVTALFARQKGQYDLLVTLNKMHAEYPPNTVIEFSEIFERIASKSGNYIRRTINKPPLSNYIKILSFEDTQGNAHNYAKCITLDFEALASLNQTCVEEIQATKSKPPVSDSGKSIVVTENELAKEQGYSKNLPTNIPSFATPELTRFLGYARNDILEQDMQRMGDGKFVKITTNKEQSRIVNAKDVVGILACAYLTKAFHQYRLAFYQQNGIRRPDNRTIISLSTIRRLLKKSRTKEVNDAIRETLAVTKETVYDSWVDLMVDGKPDPSRGETIRRRIFDCQTIIDAPKNEQEARDLFSNANIFILKWDDELFDSIINSNTLLAIPKELITIEPIFVVLYLKLRSMKKLKFKQGQSSKQETNVTDISMSAFLTNYLNMTVKEFAKAVKAASRKSNQPKGTSFEWNDELPIVELFGITLRGDVANDNFNITANRAKVFGYSSVKKGRATPTHENELAKHLMSIIAEDDEVNTLVGTRSIDYKQHEHYLVITDLADNKRYIVTRYTSDEVIAMHATLLQDDKRPRTEIVHKLKEHKLRCAKLTVTETYLEQVVEYINDELQGDVIASLDTLVMYLGDNQEGELVFAHTEKASGDLLPDSRYLAEYVHYLKKLNQ